MACDWHPTSGLKKYSSKGQTGSTAVGGVPAPDRASLRQHIGPLAKTLVCKEAGRQTRWSSLLHALAQHIDKTDDRAKFLASAAKITL